MKKIFICVLIIVIMPRATPLEQRQNALPRPDFYTLISNDGKELILERSLIERYAPALAFLFDNAVSQKDRVVLAELDFDALQNFVNLLRYMAHVSEQAAQRMGLFEEDIKKRMADIVLPLGQEAQEKELKSKQQAAMSAQYAIVVAEILDALKIHIEQLPHIADHVLQLLNETSRWQVLYLPEALAQFAAQHLDLHDPATIAQVTHNEFAPYAQLLIIRFAHYSMDNYQNIVQWLADLAQNYSVTSNSTYREILDATTIRFCRWMAHNIPEILAANPSFKNSIVEPRMNFLAGLLAENIRMYLKNSPPFIKALPLLVSDLKGVEQIQLKRIDDRRFALINANRLIIIDSKTGDILSDSTVGGVKIVDVLPLNSQRLIIFNGTDKLIEINVDGTIVKEHPLRVTIKKIQVIDSAHILAQSYNKRLWIYGLYPYEFKIIKNLDNIDDFVLLDAHTIVCINNKTQKIILFDLSTQAIVKEWDCKNDMYRVIKVDASHCFIDTGTVWQRTLGMLDIQLGTLSTLSVENLPSKNVQALNSEYILLAKFKPNTRQGSIAVMQIATGKIVREFAARYLWYPSNFFTMLDTTHLVYFYNNHICVGFIPETATLSEILEEIQQNLPAGPGPIALQATPEQQVPSLPKGPAQKDMPRMTEKQPALSVVPDDESEQEPEIMTEQEAQEFAQRRAARAKRKTGKQQKR
jgi:hypothetical protein